MLESSRNHHDPTPSVEKLSSTKLVPGAKKVGDWWSRRSLYLDPHRASGSSGSLGNVPGSQRVTPESLSGSCETPSVCTSFLYVPFLHEIPEPPPSGEVRHLLGSMPRLEFMGWRLLRGFSGGRVVKNPPSNAGDAGLISGQGTKILHGSELPSHMRPQLQSPCALMNYPTWSIGDPTCRN